MQMYQTVARFYIRLASELWRFSYILQLARQHREVLRCFQGLVATRNNTILFNKGVVSAARPVMCTLVAYGSKQYQGLLQFSPQSEPIQLQQQLQQLPETQLCAELGEGVSSVLDALQAAAQQQHRSGVLCVFCLWFTAVGTLLQQQQRQPDADTVNVLAEILFLVDCSGGAAAI